MRGFAVCLMVLALVAGVARLFTGVIYLADEPTTLLVLKQRPAAWIERPETEDLPLTEQIVLDREEPVLAYGRIYVGLMTMVPILVTVSAGAAALALIASKRRQR